MYELTIQTKREWRKEEIDKAIKELMREARIRQFVYPREHTRWRMSCGKEGISEDEGERRWSALMIALSVLSSLSEFNEVSVGELTSSRKGGLFDV